MLLATTSSNNIAIGAQAMDAVTAGSDRNVAIGTDVLTAAATTINSVGIGYQALLSASGTQLETAVGYQAGTQITSGVGNTALGASTLFPVTTGEFNIALGMFKDSGSVPVGSGWSSGDQLAAASTNNICLGAHGAAGNNGIYIGGDTHASCFVGGIAGVAPGGTPEMVIINPTTRQLGSQAIPSSSISITGDTGGALTGAAFTFTGGGASKAGVTVQFEGSGTTQTLNVTDANGNTILGGGLAINSGNANAGIGQSVLGNCTGDNNMAMGAAALFALTSGDDNIGIGYQALYAGAGIGITKGNRNIGIGSNAGSAYTSSETDNILIGYQVTGTVAENHVLRIGNGTGSGTGNLSKAFIAGINGVTSSNPLIVTINSATDQLGVTALSPSSLFPWSVITANQTAAVNNGYFCNKAGTLTLALPASSAVGDVIEVANINTATGTQITQAAGQQIFIGNTNTTSGAGGSLTSSATGDTLKLVCRTANTVWQVISMIGNWSIV